MQPVRVCSCMQAYAILRAESFCSSLFFGFQALALRDNRTRLDVAGSSWGVKQATCGGEAEAEAPLVVSEMNAPRSRHWDHDGDVSELDQTPYGINCNLKDQHPGNSLFSARVVTRYEEIDH
jgi:hypothetical protein